MRNRWWAAPAVAGGIALLAACGSSTSTPTSTGAASTTSPAAGSSAVIKTASTSRGTVLVDAAGKTIYWFAIDTPTKSNCTGSCTTYWPPVTGKVSAAPGTTLPKGFGTITGSNGKLQATYDGHPLYTYAGDTAAGQVNGNGKSLSGGYWWAITPTGAKLGAAPSPTATQSTGGGGGYY